MRTSHLLVVALLGFATPLVSQGAPAKTVIGNPTATLSPAVRVGDLLFLSGQLGGRDSSIQVQTTTALDAIKRIAEQGGSSMANLVKCTVFLTDLKDFQGMNQAYSTAFPKEPPARSTVVVAALVTPGARIEIECIGAISKP